MKNLARLGALAILALLCAPLARAQVIGGGSGNLNVGISAILGSCTNGYILYNNSGVLGCQAASISIGSAITGSTNGYGIYVGTDGSAGLLEQFAYGANVFAAIQATLNGSGAISATTSPLFTTPQIAGSSTGYTTLGSANASVTSYTATLPANTGTIAELNLAQAYTAQQNFSPIATSGLVSTTFTWAVGSAQVDQITLTGGSSYTFAAPSGLVSGGTYILDIIEPTSGGAATVGTWNAAWKFPGGTKPTFSYSAGNAYHDAITCYSPDGTNINCVFQPSFQ